MVSVLLANELPSNFRMNANETSLTISGLCRGCSGQDSGSFVVQCNASNVHGYVFAGGYVNVLGNLVLTNLILCNLF